MKIAAVVGLGNIAKRHRANIKSKFPDCRVIAMSSSGRVVPEKTQNADVFVSSIEELIECKPEFVVIASPATYHEHHAVPIIQQSIPVLIEKPLSHCSLSAEGILNAAVESSSIVVVGYCLRFLPSTQVVKELLLYGKIGKLYNVYAEVGQYLPDWRPNTPVNETVSANKDLGGGALLELSHEFDYLSYLLGSKAKFEHAVLRKSAELGLDVEDLVDVVFSLDDGPICNLHMDFLQKSPQRFCRLIGSEGRIEWDLIANKVVSYTADGECVEYNSPSWDKNQMYLSLIDSVVAKNPLPEVSPATLQEAKCVVDFIEEIKSKAVWSA